MAGAIFRRSNGYTEHDRNMEIQGSYGNDKSLLTVKDLHAWYTREKPVLSDLTVELKEHEVTGLIGLNGVGKTTFIKILSGLHENFSSSGILLHGHPADLRSSVFKTRRYTVFSEDDSFQYFTFREYLSYVLAAYKGACGKKRRDKGQGRAAEGFTAGNIAELVQGFHFEEHTDVLLKDLSTGNKKKAFLITAFALRPELLLLDEPVNGLDFQSTEFLYQMITEYKRYGTVLFSSHILESIMLTADRVLVLENGKIRKTFEGNRINAEEIREALRYENDIQGSCGKAFGN